MWPSRLRDSESPLEVHSHDRVPELICHVTDRLVADEASVIHDDVNVAILLEGLYNGFLAFFY